VPDTELDRSEALEALRSTRPKIEGADGTLHYRLYDQDGKFISMSCKDTLENRRFVEWTRMFDRYSGSGI
jgi:hypothetical protein